MMHEPLCPREDELLDALQRGYVGDELREHAASCISCGELQLVAGALLEDRAAIAGDAPLPTSGTMLWRMQMRRRRDAQSAARRSLMVGQAVTVAVAVALFVLFFGPEVTVGVKSLMASIRLSTPLMTVLLASLLAAPIAGWVAIRQK
jgi:predicted anti-sigma-YlaC factor YlaD